jgi:hypothetical protein
MIDWCKSTSKTDIMKLELLIFTKNHNSLRPKKRKCRTNIYIDIDVLTHSFYNKSTYFTLNHHIFIIPKNFHITNFVYQPYSFRKKLHDGNEWHGSNKLFKN